jgi:hypothetical protein
MDRGDGCARLVPGRDHATKAAPPSVACGARSLHE